MNVILVDTSIWIDHLRRPEQKLQKLLENDAVVGHPLVRLELALGSIPHREQVMADLSRLVQAPVAHLDELFQLVELRSLFRRGIGVTDLHLLASALLDRSIQIWTRDRRLGEVAAELGVLAADLS